MRDPDRIPIICRHLERLWQRYPDLRLGQLLENATPNERALFYVEDEELIQRVQQFLAAPPPEGER